VSAPATVTIADYALGIFGYYRTQTTYDPIITHLDYSLVRPSSPATAGEPLIVWATGIGLLANTPATGAGAPGPPDLPTAVDTPIATIGGTPGSQPAQTAQVLYAGLTPGSVGLVQINILLPTAIQELDSPLSIQFPNNTVPSVTLYLTPPAGSTSGQ